MQGQLLQTSNAAPSVDLFFFDADGVPLTTIAHNTPGLSLAFVRGTAAPVSITLAAQTPTGAYAAGGFCHVAGGKYRLDLPVAATASGIAQVSILASALPTGARSAPFVVALTPDDLTVAGPTAASVATAVWASSTRTLSSFGTLVADIASAVWGAASRTLTSGAAPTAAENAAAVESALADNFVAIPGAVVTAMRTETTLSAWGVASQPAGGSTLTYVERRNGTVIGTRTAYFSAANICVGMTAVA